MSRYVNIPQYRNIGNKLSLFSAPQFNPETLRTVLKTVYIVKQRDRMDTIASEFYDGHGELWWLIAAANNLSLPTDIVPGQMIVIPSDYKSALQTITQMNKK